MINQKFVHYAFLIFVSACFVFIATRSEATIQQLEVCGLTFGKSQAVPVIRQAPTYVIVRGDLVNTHTTIEKDSSISITQVNSTGGGGLSTSVTLEITPSSSTSGGNHSIKLHYLVEVNGPDVFTINVIPLEVNSISMTPNQSTVTSGTLLTIMATGTGLSTAHLQPDFAGMDSIHYTSQTNSSVTLTGNAHQTFSVRPVNYRINALPETGCVSNHAVGSASVLNVTVSGSGTTTIIQPILTSGGTTSPPPQPDLSVIMLNTFSSGSTFIPEEMSKYNLCPIAGGPNPKVTTIPALTVRVTNSGTADVTTPFTVTVTRNGAPVTTYTITALSKAASNDHVISRVENRVCATLDLKNPSVCLRCGSGVQGIVVWNDVGISVSVDSGHAITESNENNNVVTVQ